MSLERRRAAAAKYFPPRVRILLVGESPPAAEDRYFYFESVLRNDWLFRYVCKVVLGWIPPRNDKGPALSELRDRGIGLIDLSEEPLQGSCLADCVPDLVRRALALKPECIILVKVNVYDLAFAPLGEAGLPVVDEPIPFPAAGQQRRFEVAFPRALEQCG